MTTGRSRRRRLAGILIADVAGSSRLMGKDEEGTTERILAFHELAATRITDHGGTVGGTAGDSVLGHFDSIVEAFDCAIGLQRELHAQNATRPRDERIDARIGLHLGDVIAEDEGVFGEGVNIASRLEQLADPGGIALSAAVHQQVRHHSDVTFEDDGEQSLKNIQDPVRVLRVGPGQLGGSDEPWSDPDEGGRAVRDVIADSVNQLAERRIEAAHERAADRIAGRAKAIEREGRRRRGPGVLFEPGTLVLLTLGSLGLLADVSGWTNTAIYPFTGALILGVALGRVLDQITGRRAFVVLGVAAGFGVGALFFDSVFVRGVCWVVAAGPAGAGIQRLTKR